MLKPKDLPPNVASNMTPIKKPKAKLMNFPAGKLLCERTLVSRDRSIVNKAAQTPSPGSKI